MSDIKRLEQDIVAYLRFCREMGVRGLRTDRPAQGPAVAPAVQQPARVFMQPATLFDEAPPMHETLETIRTDLGDCRRCKLWNGRRNIVYGTGNPNAELMFVGEAPGADEDEQGLPFVGRAGQLLTRIIEAIEMQREQVYICNILKCRPPGNRNPESDEIAACEPFLLRQLAAVQPKVICALGTFGAQVLLRTKEPISRLRGQFIEYRGIKLMATYHPAYLLRNPNEKRKVWEDVQKIRDYLRSLPR
jgi:uracil-DNA glycosylase family 4